MLKGVSNIVKKQNLEADFVQFTLDLVKSANLDKTEANIFQNLHEHLSRLLMEKPSDELIK